LILRFILTAFALALVFALVLVVRNPGADWLNVFAERWLVSAGLCLALGAVLTGLSVACDWFANRKRVIGREIGKRPSQSFWDFPWP
jgi:uncharacterized integral membrane protein